MSQRLIDAQEEERSWIARELHDDVSQRLSLLMMNLRGLCDFTSLNEMRDGIHKAIGQVSALASEMRALVAPASFFEFRLCWARGSASAYCREVAGQHKVQVSFHSENIPPDLSREVSLCLFRILQEALQNAFKHSGAQHFRVSLRGGTNSMELAVQDTGTGFKPEQTFTGWASAA